MTASIFDSPWKPRRQELPILPRKDSEKPKETRQTSKVHECSWDFIVHGTTLALINGIAVLIMQSIYRDSAPPLKLGVTQAGVSTVTYLLAVEGWNAYTGKNMRKMPYISFERIAALALTLILAPVLTYGYEKHLMKKQVSFLPLMAFSALDSLGLFIIPYV